MKTPGFQMIGPVRHRPNVIGCAFGFAWIGAGVGSIVGTVIGSQVWRALPDEVRQSTSAMSTIYSWLYPSIAVGCVLGTFAGVAYALLVGRAIDKQSRARSEAE